MATLALAPAPAGLSRDQLAARFRTEAVAKASQAGRLRSYLVASEDGRVGELTLWMDTEAARAALGHDSTIEWFDVPILTPVADARRAAGGSR